MTAQTLATMMTKTKKTMTNRQIELALVIVAAGSSSRFNAGEKNCVKKEYLPLETENSECGTVLSAATKSFLETKKFAIVAITYPFSKNPDELKENEEQSRNALFADSFFATAFSDGTTKLLFVPGGETRQKSVKNALEAVSAEMKNPSSAKIVFIHDGARPFIKSSTIEETLSAALESGASVPGLQPTDTQKEIDENGFIRKHLVRATLSAVQTPQVFHLNEILEGHRRAEESNAECTDDTEIWDKFVVPFAGEKFKTVRIVKGDSGNIKITYKSDLKTQKEKTMVRVGIGYDKHILVDSAETGRKLCLGGVEIPSDKGEDGHSDGDVLLHAITDALLGASALGDIGSYFPPSDPKWKGADSKLLLKKCWDDVKAAGWKIGNIDCVIALEKPKFLPHRDEVRSSIARILGCSDECVFVKAKTGEKTGDVGTRKVVEVWCTCLLEK